MFDKKIKQTVNEIKTEIISDEKYNQDMFTRLLEMLSITSSKLDELEQRVEHLEKEILNAEQKGDEVTASTLLIQAMNNIKKGD